MTDEIPVPVNLVLKSELQNELTKLRKQFTSDLCKLERKVSQLEIKVDNSALDKSSWVFEFSPFNVLVYATAICWIIDSFRTKA